MNDILKKLPDLENEIDNHLNIFISSGIVFKSISCISADISFSFITIRVRWLSRQFGREKSSIADLRLASNVIILYLANIQS